MELKNIFIFIKKKFIAGMRISRKYLNPSGTRMKFNFSFPLDIARIAGKYITIEYGDRECKTCPRPIAMPTQGWL